MNVNSSLETYAWDLLEELQNLFGNETRLGLVLNINIIDRLAPFEEALGIVCVLFHKCLGLLILIGLVIVLAPVEVESFSFVRYYRRSGEMLVSQTREI